MTTDLAPTTAPFPMSTPGPMKASAAIHASSPIQIGPVKRPNCLVLYHARPRREKLFGSLLLARQGRFYPLNSSQLLLPSSFELSSPNSKVPKFSLLDRDALSWLSLPRTNATTSFAKRNGHGLGQYNIDHIAFQRRRLSFPELPNDRRCCQRSSSDHSLSKQANKSRAVSSGAGIRRGSLQSEDDTFRGCPAPMHPLVYLPQLSGDREPRKGTFDKSAFRFRPFVFVPDQVDSNIVLRPSSMLGSLCRLLSLHWPPDRCRDCILT